MPSLIAFGRRWNIASDDFVFPSLSEALVRLAWILSTSVIFMMKRWRNCTDHRVLIYLFSLISTNGITILICFILAFTSAQGSILEPQKRHHVSKIIYIRLALFLIEIGVTTASAIFAFGTSTLCNLTIVIRFTVVLQWGLIITVLLGVAVVFNPSGDNRIQPSFRSENQLWTLRFKLFSLGRNEAMRAALDDIAILTTSFFADVDLVASDILAGLLLLVHAPHQPPTSVTYVPETEPPNWMTLENARYMAKYIAAIYGWEIYMFYNCGCCNWFRIFKNIRCCHCCRRQKFVTKSENCCMCTTATFLTVAECKETDVVFVSFANQLYQVPFIVLVDAKSNSIVITIRGTASMMDAINDLSLDDEAFSVDVDQDPILRRDEKLDVPDQEVRVHRGMLRSARYVFEMLRANRILEGLKMSHPDYTVVVCGHSLGAGVATLLTLLLKQSFSSIRCFAFSPPGCVINESGLRETEKFVFSIYIGDDIVPRLSFQTMCKLKYDVIRSLASSDSPKYKVLLRGFYRLCFSSPWEPNQMSQIEEPVVVNINDRLPLVFHNPLMFFDNGNNAEANNPAEKWARARIKLLPPGRLLHVWVTSKKKKTILKRWTKYSSLDEIKLSSAVISDHMPYHVLKVLNMELEPDP